MNPSGVPFFPVTLFDREGAPAEDVSVEAVPAEHSRDLELVTA